MILVFWNLLFLTFLLFQMPSDKQKTTVCLTLHICIIPNCLRNALKIFRRGYTPKEADRKKKKKKPGTMKQTYSASKCGGNPSNCQVEVVRSDKMVIDLGFIHPHLLTFDELPNLILLVPTYLF